MGLAFFNAARFRAAEERRKKAKKRTKLTAAAVEAEPRAGKNRASPASPKRGKK